MFRIFIVIFIFSVSFYLYKDYTNIMELKTTHDEWARIIKVEEKQMGSKFGPGGVYWIVTVRLSNGRSVNVDVNYSPAPKKDGCLPISVGTFATGGMLAILNHEQWRHDYTSPRVAPCKTSLKQMN